MQGVTVLAKTEVCASHTKRVGENKSFLQLKNFAEVLLTGYPFKIIKQVYDCGKFEMVDFINFAQCKGTFLLLRSEHYLERHIGRKVLKAPNY